MGYVLVAARDRYGIKSLYYTVAEGRLLVGTKMIFAVWVDI